MTDPLACVLQRPFGASDSEWERYRQYLKPVAHASPVSGQSTLNDAHIPSVAKPTSLKDDKAPVGTRSGEWATYMELVKKTKELALLPANKQKQAIDTAVKQSTSSSPALVLSAAEKGAQSAGPGFIANQFLASAKIKETQAKNKNIVPSQNNTLDFVNSETHRGVSITEKPDSHPTESCLQSTHPENEKILSSETQNSSKHKDSDNLSKESSNEHTNTIPEASTTVSNTLSVNLSKDIQNPQSYEDIKSTSTINLSDSYQLNENPASSTSDNKISACQTMKENVKTESVSNGKKGKTRRRRKPRGEINISCADDIFSGVGGTNEPTEDEGKLNETHDDAHIPLDSQLCAREVIEDAKEVIEDAKPKANLIGTSLNDSPELSDQCENIKIGEQEVASAPCAEEFKKEQVTNAEEKLRANDMDKKTTDGPDSEKIRNTSRNRRRKRSLKVDLQKPIPVSADDDWLFGVALHQERAFICPKLKEGKKVFIGEQEEIVTKAEEEEEKADQEHCEEEPEEDTSVKVASRTVEEADDVLFGGASNVF
eukprot:m.279279 g.279279  ORF g.279279 m.279279 type:complete len:542 (-) comp16321_c1_seq13:4455-6080(-)